MTKGKKIVALSLGTLLVASSFAGCGKKSNDISVVTREEGSGTRGAFVELTGVEEKDESGNKKDNTTTDAITCNSTEVVLTTVAGDDFAVGYVSLGSLNDTVKPLKIEGVEATAENIKDGSYTLARPFNIVTKDDINEVSEDFIAYILSEDGQFIISDNGYIEIDNSGAFKPAEVKGKIVVAGSSSVTPVMEKLAEGYMAINSDVEIEIQESDSTTGVTSAIDGTCDIGMASRELKDSETSEGVASTVIAMDGIVVVVNKNNDTVDDLTLDQVKSIFTGSKTSWDDFK